MLCRPMVDPASDNGRFGGSPPCACNGCGYGHVRDPHQVEPGWQWPELTRYMCHGRSPSATLAKRGAQRSGVAPRRVQGYVLMLVTGSL